VVPLALPHQEQVSEAEAPGAGADGGDGAANTIRGILAITDSRGPRGFARLRGLDRLRLGCRAWLSLDQHSDDDAEHGSEERATDGDHQSPY
jgi:hypothetical protein